MSEARRSRQVTSGYAKAGRPRLTLLPAGPEEPAVTPGPEVEGAARRFGN